MDYRHDDMLCLSALYLPVDPNAITANSSDSHVVTSCEQKKKNISKGIQQKVMEILKIQRNKTWSHMTRQFSIDLLKRLTLTFLSSN